ncbi:MAG: ketoacyl-ACP synthase III [Desulfovibrio sp.]|jgi:3-oxoacyl-[acyl-carrier-protein] synthase-3|nr:ketoacyl-ACP synthase III [Desulfovibrio sp.]
MNVSLPPSAAAVEERILTFTEFSGVTLAALQAVVPAKSVSLKDELFWFDGDPEKARRLTEISGLETRRVAPDGVTAVDLCACAAEQLLRENAVNRDDIGMILFASHSPDYLLPASASILQHRLGLSTRCGAIDANGGCTSFLNGLWLLAALLASGALKAALLLVGDTPARFADPGNRVVAPVFGDAGTAALLRAAPGKSMSFSLAGDGKKHDALTIPGGGSRIPFSARDGLEGDGGRDGIVRDRKNTPWSLGGYCRIWMDGMAIYSFGVSAVPRHIRSHLDKAGLTPQSIRRIFLHQANKIMVEGIARKSGFAPRQAPFDALGLYGNLGSSSIPVQVCRHFADGARDGERDRLMLCAFGAGLSVASCILSLDDAKIGPVSDYFPPEGMLRREGHIHRWHRTFSGK